MKMIFQITHHGAHVAVGMIDATHAAVLFRGSVPMQPGPASLRNAAKIGLGLPDQYTKAAIQALANAFDWQTFQQPISLTLFGHSQGGMVAEALMRHRSYSAAIQQLYFSGKELTKDQLDIKTATDFILDNVEKNIDIPSIPSLIIKFPVLEDIPESQNFLSWIAQHYQQAKEHNSTSFDRDVFLKELTAFSQHFQIDSVITAGSPIILDDIKGFNKFNAAMGTDQIPSENIKRYAIVEDLIPRISILLKENHPMQISTLPLQTFLLAVIHAMPIIIKIWGNEEIAAEVLKKNGYIVNNVDLEIVQYLMPNIVKFLQILGTDPSILKNFHAAYITLSGVPVPNVPETDYLLVPLMEHPNSPRFTKGKDEKITVEEPGISH